MRSENQKPAPTHAVVQRLKEIIRDPTIIENFNKKRHVDDRIENEIDYLAYYFGVSYRTIYRRLRKAGVTVAKIRRSINDLNVNETIEAYNLKEFQPIVYNVDSPKVKKDIIEDAIITIGDLQMGALRNAHGFNDDPYGYLKKYFTRLKNKLTHKLLYTEISTLTIVLLGDLVDGENIYIGQDVIPVHKQVSYTADLIYDFIQWVSAFNIDFINVYSVRGNHGNLSKYYSKESNWDNVVAELIAIRYDIHHKYDSALNVSIYTTKDQYFEFKVGKWTVVIHHGDFIKGAFSKGTTSFNTKPLEMHMESMKLTKFRNMDALIIGHWHRFHFGELLGMNYVVNGTCYESDFVQTTLMSKETLSMVFITVGDDVPFKTVELLYLGDNK